MDESCFRFRIEKTATMPSTMNGLPPNSSWYERALSITDRRRRSLGQSSGATAIHDAIAKGKVHLAKFILDAVDGDIVNARDIHGKTPLIRACKIREEKARIKAVQLLLGRGADVNLRDNMGRTALSYACELRCNDIVRILVQNNVDPDVEDNNGNTALMYCASVGNDKAVEILTKSFRRLGLDVDRENDEGMTPLMMSAKNGYLECATLLAQEGKASVDRRDSVRNLNAEEWARENGCTTPEVESFASIRRSTGANRRFKGLRPFLISTSQSSDSDQSCQSSFEDGDKDGSDSDVSQEKVPKSNTKKASKELSIEELAKKFTEVQKNRGIPVPTQMPPPSFNKYRYAKRCSLPNVTVFQNYRMEVIRDDDNRPAQVDEDSPSPVEEEDPQQTRSPKLFCTGKSNSMDDTAEFRDKVSVSVQTSRRNSAASVHSRKSPIIRSRDPSPTRATKDSQPRSRQTTPIPSPGLQKSKSEYVTVTSLPAGASAKRQGTAPSRPESVRYHQRDDTLTSVESASHIEFDFDSETRGRAFPALSPRQSQTEYTDSDVFLPPIGGSRDSKTLTTKQQCRLSNSDVSH